MERRDELMELFIEQHIEVIAEFIREKIGCSGCPAKSLCEDYKDTVYNGDCAWVLESYLNGTEEEDTEQARARELAEWQAQCREENRSWYHR